MRSVFAASLLGVAGLSAVMHDASPSFQAGRVPSASTPFGVNDAAGRRLDVGGTSIYYEVYGEGSPVLLLHGGLYGYISEYGPYIVELARRHRVIAVATRGHGRSDVGTTPFSHPLHAADALAVLRRETREPALVVGFSYGATTAYRLAASNPTAVRKLVAIGAGSATSPDAAAWARGLDAAAFARDNAGFVQARKALMRQPDEWPRFFDLLRASMASPGEFTAADAAAIRCPVLIIGGDRDFYNPVSVFEGVHARLAGSRLVILKGADHVQSLQRPDVLRDHVLPFLLE